MFSKMVKKISVIVLILIMSLAVYSFIFGDRGIWFSEKVSRYYQLQKDLEFTQEHVESQRETITKLQEELTLTKNNLKTEKTVSTVLLLAMTYQTVKLQETQKELNYWRQTYGPHVILIDGEETIEVLNWGHDYSIENLIRLDMWELDRIIQRKASPLYIYPKTGRYAVVVPVFTENLEIDNSVGYWREKWGLENITDNGQPFKKHITVYARPAELWRQVDYSGMSRLYLIFYAPVSDEPSSTL